jgi:phenylalanyl-tRNA synthetase beta chain
MIEFPVAEVARLTGLRVETEEVIRILTRLGFTVLGGAGETLRVAVPSYRPDVTQKADLVEEVMRMVGLDKVPVDPLPRLSHVAPRMLTGLQNRRRAIKRVLAARGLDEAVTWSFITTDEARRFGGGSETLQLANPIASELTDMRPSLLPGLLGAVRRNQNRGFGDVKLFECGQIFKDDTPAGQRTYAAAIRTGSARHWRERARAVDVFDAKADLAALLDALGHDIDKVQIVAEPASWSHPGRGGRIQLGPQTVLGWFGEVHPGVLAEFDITGPVAAFELDLDAIAEPRRKPTRAKPPFAMSDLMAVSRDFAFVVDRDVTAAAILRAARNADKALIVDAGVFDVFEGASVGENRKSVAISVTLQPKDKTLTDEEIEKVASSVVASVTKATGGTLRT